MLAGAPVGGGCLVVAAGEPADAGRSRRCRAGRARRRRGRAGAAAGQRSSARRRRRRACSCRNASSPASLSARSPRRVSSSSAVTVSSSLRPLTARMRSGSNGRAEHGRRGDDLSRDLAHAGHARLEQAAHAGRKRRAVRLRVEVLDDEERQPLRLLEQPLRELRRRARPRLRARRRRRGRAVRGR